MTGYQGEAILPDNFIKKSFGATAGFSLQLKKLIHRSNEYGR